MSEKGMISIVLPTYNEKDNIVMLIDKIMDILNDRSFEIIVVDDDSPDLTWKIVMDTYGGEKRISLIHRTSNRGLTASLNEGISHARGDIVVWMDCDLQMPSTLIPMLLAPIDNGDADVVIGSRFIEGGKDLRYHNQTEHKKFLFIHAVLSRFICRLTSAFFNTEMMDWTSGFIAIKREIFKSVTLYGNYGEYFMYLLHFLIRSNYKIIQIPYILIPRESGFSKTTTNYVEFIVKGVKYLTALVYIAISKKDKGIL